MAIESSDIETLAETPQRVRNDEGEVQERSVKELIEADRYNRATTGNEQVPWGIRVAKIKPGPTA